MTLDFGLTAEIIGVTSILYFLGEKKYESRMPKHVAEYTQPQYFRQLGQGFSRQFPIKRKSRIFALLRFFFTFFPPYSKHELCLQ